MVPTWFLPLIIGCENFNMGMGYSSMDGHGGPSD